MDQQQKIKKLVNQFKKEMFEGTTAKHLADNHGFRLRETKDSKNLTAWELGSTYFYQANSSLNGNFVRMRDWFYRNGFSCEAVTHSGQPIKYHEVSERSSWEMNNWPKDSWNKIGRAHV